MANFPASVPVFPTRLPRQSIFPQHMNDLQEEVSAIAYALLHPTATTGPKTSPLVIQGVEPTLQLDDTGAPLPQVRLISDAAGVLHLTTNAALSGGVWTADDVAAMAGLLQLRPDTGRLVFSHGPVSANPRVFSEVFSVEESGAIRERGRAVAMGEWVPYTPVWTAQTTQPVLGNGTLVGSYTVIGKTVHARFFFALGTTSTQGTGAWIFSVPPGFPIGPNGQVVGCARINQNVYGVNSILAWTATTVVSLIETGQACTVNVPWVWGANHGVSALLTYETP